MYVTTVMVIMMIVWCGYTLMVRGVHLPPLPHLRNLVYANDSLGWLNHTSLALHRRVHRRPHRTRPLRPGHER